MYIKLQTLVFFVVSEFIKREEKTIKYLFKVTSMKPHMSIESRYVFELAVTQVALDRFDVAGACASRAACRAACGAAPTRTAAAFLTALLCL